MKRATITSILLSLFFLLITTPDVQADPSTEDGNIKGKIVNKKSPVIYATIKLLTLDDKLVSGAITDYNGMFTIANVEKGVYRLEISFIGFETQYIENIEILSNKQNLNLGKIEFRQVSNQIEGVEVVAEQAAVSYKIDRKVVNVSRDATAAGGTAIDALENVPSITVDIDRTVRVRGSEGFQVLIDGKPSILTGSEALEQIPATMIENIEIITNPSAKFDPDGTAGIINIVTKTNGLQGMAGIANIKAGLNNKYGGDVTLNYNIKKWQFSLGGNYNNYKTNSTFEDEKWTKSGDSTFFLNSTGNGYRKREFYSFKAGATYHLNENNNFSLNGRFGNMQFPNINTSYYAEWTTPSFGDNTTYYLSNNESTREGSFGGINADYTHYFDKKNNHMIIAQIQLRARDMDEKAIDFLRDTTQLITSGQRSTENGSNQNIRGKIDYTYPFSENGKIESGYQMHMGEGSEVNELYYYDTETQAYVFQDEFSHTTNYQRDIHALYALVKNEYKKFGYQLGLRGEYTNRVIALEDTDDKYTIDRWDIFPTAHFSYSLNQSNQFILSYSRRIERPRMWYLEPFITWQDAYNVQKGNPSLKPEYIDAYELGYQLRFGDNFFSVEGYFRQTNNKVERVQYVYSEGVMLHTVENVGTDYSTGVELMYNQKITKWWGVNLMGNLYNYQVVGTLYDEDFSRESLSWSSRINNSFNITKTTKIQLNLNYRSAIVSAQGESEGYFSSDFAVRQSFYDRKLSLILQVKDIFGTAKNESYSEGPNFWNYHYRERESPIVMLTASFRLNNYKEDISNELDNDIEEF